MNKYVLLLHILLKMKNRILGLIVLTGFILGIQSCKEEITSNEAFIETAVVYGLLDISNSEHMIKITRAFIGDGVMNSNLIAGNPDSSYFQSVTGTVTEYINSIPARVFTLSDTTVLNKDEDGIFYAPTQKLYYFTTDAGSPLNGDAEYRLDLDINNGEFQVSAQTVMVNSMQETTSDNNVPFSFVQSNGTILNRPVSVNTGTASRVNCTLEVDFTEFVGSDSTIKSFQWNLGELDVENNNTHEFQAKGQLFYDKIKSNVTNNSAITKRNLNGIRFVVTGGSQDLTSYILINQPSSSLAQTKPSFTNLEATNGHPVVGVFTSTQTLNYYVPFVGGSNFIRCISTSSTEHLCNGPQTFDLLFCSNHPGDALKTWFCP